MIYLQSSIHAPKHIMYKLGSREELLNPQRLNNHYNEERGPLVSFLIQWNIIILLTP